MDLRLLVDDDTIKADTSLELALYGHFLRLALPTRPINTVVRQWILFWLLFQTQGPLLAETLAAWPYEDTTALLSDADLSWVRHALVRSSAKGVLAEPVAARLLEQTESHKSAKRVMGMLLGPWTGLGPFARLRDHTNKKTNAYTLTPEGLRLRAFIDSTYAGSSWPGWIHRHLGHAFIEMIFGSAQPLNDEVTAELVMRVLRQWPDALTLNLSPQAPLELVTAWCQSECLNTHAVEGPPTYVSRAAVARAASKLGLAITPRERYGLCNIDLPERSMC